jgi:hypothetical protein
MSARPFGKPSAGPAPQRSRLLRLAAIATGIVVGTAVQQRISEGAAAGAFVVLLLGERAEATSLVAIALVSVVGTGASASTATCACVTASLAGVQLMFAWQLAKKAGLR